MRWTEAAVMQVKAVIFDVDGTLYEPRPVRLRMAARLLRSYLATPREGLAAARLLRAYRRAQETLRTAPVASDLAARQLELACRWSKTRPEIARALVARWMENEPLDLLLRSARCGVKDFLERARRRGVRLGVFSDYPAEQKLAAMGLAECFDAVISAQHQGVQRFKPEPLGLELVLRVLGVGRQEALYVGDRPEVDATAAARAGMNCAIIGSARTPREAEWLGVAGFSELAAFLAL